MLTTVKEEVEIEVDENLDGFDVDGVMDMQCDSKDEKDGRTVG